MINQYEVPMYLEDTLPGISGDLESSGSVNNIYCSVHVFLDYTFKQIRANNLPVVKQCFILADKLYSKGNKLVRSAVEQVYVFSFSNLPVSTIADKNRVLALIPCTLYTLYMKQVMHHGA